MTQKQRLELTWIGKHDRPKLEPRVLLDDTGLSYAAHGPSAEEAQYDNRLIFGDNLLALRALEQEFTQRIKCIYIDPPYNSGTAFTHYHDGLAHSEWLSAIQQRAELLRRLLRDDGVLFVSIDDDEQAYLKVLLDEVFGRTNFCGQFVWEKKKKPSFLNANMGTVTEYVLCYAKNRAYSPAFIGGTTTPGKKYPINNAGNRVRDLRFPAGAVRFTCPDRVFQAGSMSEGNIVTELLDEVVVVDGRNRDEFRLRGEWRYSQQKIREILSAGEEIVISKAPFRPNHVKRGGEPKKLKNLLSIAHYGTPTYEDASEESRALFGSDAFDYPKPEKLIATLIAAVTQPGDWVLDSFAGSGTTGAVAHKLGLRWIMVELGEQAMTLIAPRLRKVIDGNDPGGITAETGWAGGGGFRFQRLAPSMLERDKYGNWIVSKQYNPVMLAEAMSKHEGFTFAPSDEVYWQHGRSTEADFIYVTTQTLGREQLAQLSEEVGPDRSLLVCCAAFRANADEFPNLTIKKIPHAVLNRCEWGRDDYSLSILQLTVVPVADSPEAAAAEPAASSAPRRSGRRAAAQEPDLFEEGDQ